MPQIIIVIPAIHFSLLHTYCKVWCVSYYSILVLFFFHFSQPIQNSSIQSSLHRLFCPFIIILSYTLHSFTNRIFHYVHTRKYSSTQCPSGNVCWVMPPGRITTTSTLTYYPTPPHHQHHATQLFTICLTVTTTNPTTTFSPQFTVALPPGPPSFHHCSPPPQSWTE